MHINRPPIPRLRSLPSKIAERWSWRWTLVIAIVISAALTALIQLMPLPNETATSPDSTETKAYVEQLRNQVDTTTGAPRSGRDPASQQQNSLASAASQPTGIGQRIDKPAAGVTGDQSRHATSSDVYTNSSQTGLGSNGCYVDYGKPGEQCLPAHAATNGIVTCDGVHHNFPNGIIVSGTDRFHLDKNLDGIACNSGD